MPIRGTIERYPDSAALARAAAAGFATLASRAIAERGRFAAALTGGSSPRALLSILGDPAISGGVHWGSVHLFWGDDRCVPPGHPRSNYGMARDLFISRVPIPAENVHRIRGELPPDVAAREYAAELRDFFDAPLPRFDLVHLGLGDDGHIASLFPFDLPRLTEREAPVLTSIRLPEGEPRVTLSVPAINAAARVEFLLPPPKRGRAARLAMHGPLDPFRTPAQLVRPGAGELVWLTAG